MENVRYLGSVTYAWRGNEEDIKARIVAAWKKWQELTGGCLLLLKGKYTEHDKASIEAQKHRP